jgi:prephenate dehydrogenase
MALDLKKRGFAESVVGVDTNEKNAQRAMELGIVDEITGIEGAIKMVDVIILAVPVDATIELINKILPQINMQVLIDVGSTKEPIVKAANLHENRKQFVAAHPMAGTEFSGPDAAISGLFDDKAVILCEKEKSSEQALKLACDMFSILKMRQIEMNAQNHDVHAAYISHISHISSFALALSVLHKEKDEKSIFEMASGGFASTVRLAKSSPDMWAPIFLQNKKNVTEVLDTYINFLYEFKLALFNNDQGRLMDLMTMANKIRPILDS